MSLRETKVLRVAPVSLCLSAGKLAIRLDGVDLSDMGIETFARKDGFKDAAEMAAQFEKMRGLPFSGIVIYWE